MNGEKFLYEKDYKVYNSNSDNFDSLWSSYLHFAPVNFDVGSCSGGYERWVVDNYTANLIDTFISKQGYDKEVKYNLISNPEEIASTISWQGRTIRANIKIEIDNKIYDVNFSGKRYWIEKYNWKVDR